MSKIECYTCHKFGDYARDCRQNKKKPKRRFQASVADAEKEEDEEPKKKKKTKANKTNEPKRKYYLISTLTGSFSDCSTSWLVDSGLQAHDRQLWSSHQLQKQEVHHSGRTWR